MEKQEILIAVKVKGLKKVKEATASVRELNEEIKKTIQLVKKLNDLD